MPQNGSASQLVEILTQATAMGASDIHLTAGQNPTLRIKGQLHLDAIQKPLSSEVMLNELKAMIREDAYEAFIKRNDRDFSFKVESLGRFRIDIYWKGGGPAMAIRHIPERIPTLDELEAPEAALDFVHLHQGIVLVTGPTGSGKSTLLAAMIEEINQKQNRHIITLEDPIEFVYQQKKCLISQREMGIDFPHFADGLKHAFRQDPDVVLVGEMRDVETMESALTIAETGHVVFSTLHTNNASQTVERIINAFPASRQNQVRLQLSFVLRGVISQILLPTVDGNLTAAREIMVGTPAISNLIRQGETEQIQNVIYSGIQEKMVDLDRDLESLLEEGRISPEIAMEHSRNKDLFVTE